MLHVSTRNMGSRTRQHGGVNPEVEFYLAWWCSTSIGCDNTSCCKRGPDAALIGLGIGSKAGIGFPVPLVYATLARCQKRIECTGILIALGPTFHQSGRIIWSQDNIYQWCAADRH